jgi:hypothetical protein
VTRSRLHRSTPGRPLLSGLALALLSVAQLASVAHQFSARHQTCAHGQVVDADEADELPAGPAHEVGEQDAAHLLAPEEARAEAAHVHCLASALLQTAAACAVAALPASAGPSNQHALPPAEGARAVPREVLLLLAPKSSPPA